MNVARNRHGLLIEKYLVDCLQVGFSIPSPAEIKLHSELCSTPYFLYSYLLSSQPLLCQNHINLPFLRSDHSSWTNRILSCHFHEPPKTRSWNHSLRPTVPTAKGDKMLPYNNHRNPLTFGSPSSTLANLFQCDWS